MLKIIFITINSNIWCHVGMPANYGENKVSFIFLFITTYHTSKYIKKLIKFSLESFELKIFTLGI